MGLIGIGLGSPGNPHILVRYMALKNPKDMRFAALLASCRNVVMGWGAIMIGLLGRVYFPDIAMLPAGNREAVFMTLGNALLNPFMQGTMLAAILAAIMSSVDSQLLVASSAVIRDLYDQILSKGKQLSQSQLVRQQPQWTLAFLPNVRALTSRLLFGITYEAVPGFIVAVTVMVIVSMFTKKPENVDRIMADIAGD